MEQVLKLLARALYVFIKTDWCFIWTKMGKYKSHEPELVMIIVKELGIKGWLKGER